MKSPAFLLATALLALTALPASAVIIGVDTFDYSNGNVVSQNGGTFWDYKNTAPAGRSGTASTWDVVTNTPTFNAGQLVTSGNAVAKREYNGSNESEGAISDTNVANTVYYRVNVTTGPSVTPGDYFGISSVNAGTEIFYFGKRGVSPNWAVEQVGVGGTNSTLAVQPNQTYTLVAQVDLPGNAIRLYVNPDLNSAQSAPFNASTALAASQAYNGTAASTGVRFAAGTAVRWDNLVVATTWEELRLTVVTTLEDEDDGASALLVPNDISLREAVKYSSTGSLITFAPGLSGQTMTLTGGQLLIEKSLTIDASALAGGITIDANGAVTNHRVMQINPNNTVALRGLTLTGGRATELFFPGSLGGAIFANGTLSGNSVRLTLTACTISGNSATYGGGIASSCQGGSATLSLIACTLSGNSASHDGGGIFSDGLLGGAVLSLTASTVSGNSATNGGGIYSNGDSGSATLNLHNTILAGNTAPTGPDLREETLGATTNATGRNLMSSTAGSNLGANPSNITLITDPKLSPLAHFGGPVQTMHPLIGSPAIDGSLDETPGDAMDARGFPGLVDGDIASPGAQYDLGAVEAGPLVTVTDNAADGTNSLRGKISQGALTTVGARIGFSPSMFPTQTILLDGDTEIFIPATPGLFIDASNLSGPVTISGNHATRVINIIQGATVAMHSLKIVDGTAAVGADGGGILNEGTCTVMSCTLSGNSANTGGGGAIGNIGTLALTQSTLSGNVGLLGGAVYSDSLTVATQCTFANNFGSFRGGAIENFGPMVLSECTFANNSAATDVGGILNFSQLTLHNTIVAGNNSPGGQDVLMSGGTISAIGVNFIGLPAGSTLSASPTLLTGNPLLAPLGDYGGRTQTMPPLRGSPAVDASTVTTSQTDQRGSSRSRDGDGDFTALPDIGAVEASLIPVTTINDSGLGSLRAALAEASTHPGPDTLFFIPSISTDISLADEILIDDPAGVTLDASDIPFGIVIDAGPGTYRHFRIAAGTPAVFQRLRLQGGNGTGGGGTTDGGSIHTSGILTLRECTIADNTSPSSAGAILSEHPGVLTLERCTLYGNFANAGGGAITQLSQNLLTLTACTIAINSAGSEAGGINAPFGRPVLLDHCSIIGNTVTQAGANGVGGVRGDGGGVPGITVRNSIISGNTDANFPGTPDLSAFRTLQENNLIGGDSKLAPFGDYGGLTFTAPPLPGSPAINAATGSTTDFDQRGFARIGTADLGAAEFSGAADVRLYWLSDWDGDGQLFGIEHALGTDPLLPDRNNLRNLTAPFIDSLGRRQLTFGVNNSATLGTKWILSRSIDLVNFTETFRYDGTSFFFNNTQVNVVDNGTTITVIDRIPPPGKAFYRFEAIAP